MPVWEKAHAPITVVIESSNELVRIGLQAIIKARAHINVVGEATNISEAEAIIAREKPHLLMVEVEGKPNILGLVRQLRASFPTLQIIFISGIDEARCTWQALSSGRDGMVLSIQPAAALLATIDYVCQGPAKPLTAEQNPTQPQHKMAQSARIPDAPPRTSSIL